MKVSLSLSDRCFDRLGELVRSFDSNKSVICEAAIWHFDSLSESDKQRLARETMAAKWPRTRTGWRALFWSALGEEMGVQDFALGKNDYLMAARTYLGFQVLHDARHDLNPASDDREMIVFIETAPPYTDKTIRIGNSWTFRVGDSVFDAARDVAKWLRANAPTLAAGLPAK